MLLSPAKTGIEWPTVNSYVTTSIGDILTLCNRREALINSFGFTACYGSVQSEVLSSVTFLIAAAVEPLVTDIEEE
jgi:hypothetical protein